MELKDHAFFAFFDEATVGWMTESCEQLTYKDGDVVFREGDASDSIYLVMSGNVGIQKEDESHHGQVIAAVGEGYYFGEFGVLDGQPRSASAIAQGETVLAKLLKATLFEGIQRAPDGCALDLVAHIINKFRHANDRYMEERLRRERQTLVGQMASEIIHDFKNPFTVIRLSASAMKDKYDDPAMEKYCGLIEGQIKRMLVMADELLEFSRGKTRLTLEKMDMGALLDKFESFNTDYLANLNVELSIDPISKFIKADIDKLLRVLQNITNNAADAFKGKQGHIKVSAEDKENEVVIHIADDGPGIPPEIQPALFESFATFGKKKGLGLGMAIAKSIVVAHGGSIEFETAEDKGTTFHITLPVEAQSGGDQ